MAFTNGTLSFDIFDSYANSDGNPVYSFCNSAFNGGCTGGNANAAPVATFTIARAAGVVPEPATWTMMILCFGLRYRRKGMKVSFA